MARLRDLVNVDLGTDVIQVQEAEIPVSFGFDAMEYIADFYTKEQGSEDDADYSDFENELNWMRSLDSVKLNGKTLKIMRALVYGMVRSGGTECTPRELNSAIPFSQIPDVFQVCLALFDKQNFQGEDLKKSAKPQDRKKAAPKKKVAPKKK